MSTRGPKAWFMQAQTAAQIGNRTLALDIIKQGIAEHPREAGLHHAAGKMVLDTGDAAAAADWFGKAHALAPGNVNFAIDQATALATAGQHGDALAVLRTIEPKASDSALYWSTRAFAERAAGDLGGSAQSYDRALALEPQRKRALQGRATVALERGESNAVQWFDRALKLDQTDPHMWYSKAQALDVAGRSQDAREIMSTLLAKIPQWPDALKFVAQMRLAAGEKDFTSHYADAAKLAPEDPNIPVEHAAQLFGLDYFSEAADVITRARQSFAGNPRLALLDAIYSGAAGDIEKAERLYAADPTDSEERWVHEGRFAIRTGRLDRAEQVLERALQHNPRNIATWAYRGIVWRMTGDPRAEWLHEQTGLVQLLELHDAESVLPSAIELLKTLHDSSPFPLGQSLRGGTQTRGQLFQRPEPELQALAAAVLSTLEEYRAGLPPADSNHPLLRDRDAPWGFANSWSVRLAGGGDYHTAHIHPQGLLSSALYLNLPRHSGDDDESAGWLEVGRPPPDLGLDLEPLQLVEPKQGHLALFPSTLFHGTRPFSEGRRMTVAFDVQPHMDQK